MYHNVIIGSGGETANPGVAEGRGVGQGSPGYGAGGLRCTHQVYSGIARFRAVFLATS